MGENEGDRRRVSAERGFVVFKVFGEAVQARKVEKSIQEILIKVFLYNCLMSVDT